MKREQFMPYFFIGLFLFIFYQLILIFSPFFAAIFWAGVLAFAVYPLYGRLQKFIPTPPSLTAFVTTCLVILVVLPPTILVLVSLMKDAISFYQQVSAYISAGNVAHLIESIRETVTSTWAKETLARWAPYEENLSGMLMDGAKRIGNFAAVQLTTFTKNLLSFGLHFLLVTFLLFFFLRDGKKIYEAAYKLIPMEEKNKLAVSDKINDTLAAVIRGQFITSIVQAALAGFIFWFLGFPLPLLFGVATFLASLIPMTGSATVWAPFAVYLFVIQDYTKAFSLLAFGALVISASDNILKPVLIGERTKLPVFLLFLGILGGLQLYGFTGIFLGPIVLSLFFALVTIYQEQY